MTRRPSARTLRFAVAALLCAVLAPLPGGAAGEARGVNVVTRGASALVETAAGDVVLVAAFTGYGSDTVGGTTLVVIACRAGATCQAERRGVRAGELTFSASGARLDAVTGVAGRVAVEWAVTGNGAPRVGCEQMARNGEIMEVSLLGAAGLAAAGASGTVGGVAIAPLCAGIATNGVLEYQAA